MKRIIILILILFPSSLFAFTPIHTGHDLYHSLKLADDPQNMNDMMDSTYALGYLRGAVDGIIYMQNHYYDRLFPANTMTEKEIKDYSKKLDLVLLNIPEEGRADGQIAYTDDRDSDSEGRRTSFRLMANSCPDDGEQ